MIDFSCLLLLIYFCSAGLPRVGEIFSRVQRLSSSEMLRGRSVETAHEYVSGTQGRQGSQKLQTYCQINMKLLFSGRGISEGKKEGD